MTERNVTLEIKDDDGWTTQSYALSTRALCRRQGEKLNVDVFGFGGDQSMFR